MMVVHARPVTGHFFPGPRSPIRRRSGPYPPYLYVTWDRLPNPPTNVVVTANADGTATVNWTLATVPAGGSAVDWYVVHALNPDLSYAGQTAVVCATCTTATLTNLARSKDYVLGVFPHNGAGYTFAPSNQITTMAIDNWRGEATQSSIPPPRATERRRRRVSGVRLERRPRVPGEQAVEGTATGGEVHKHRRRLRRSGPY